MAQSNKCDAGKSSKKDGPEDPSFLVSRSCDSQGQGVPLSLIVPNVDTVAAPPLMLFTVGR